MRLPVSGAERAGVFDVPTARARLASQAEGAAHDARPRGV